MTDYTRRAIASSLIYVANALMLNYLTLISRAIRTG